MRSAWRWRKAQKKHINRALPCGRLRRLMNRDAVKQRVWDASSRDVLEWWAAWAAFSRAGFAHGGGHARAKKPRLNTYQAHSAGVYKAANSLRSIQGLTEFTDVPSPLKEAHTCNFEGRPRGLNERVKIGLHHHTPEGFVAIDPHQRNAQANVVIQ